ncbi:uncharacterized protein [Diadema setosum]|uniref:uncharacterized protein n=1 Tax=Diadema setosum TaxID=31175 RepID=UPI003B3B3C55
MIRSENDDVAYGTSTSARNRVRSRSRRSTDFSLDELLAILDKHNELRGQVSPQASNMERMSWDDDLATMAQEWSEGCYFGHGQPDNISPFSTLGQNLWLGTAGNTPPDGTGAVQAWYNEVQYYDYDTTECSYVCGHYTQVVWASSYALGCGRALCATASSDTANYTNVYIITCNYGPAGNYQGAQPYQEGDSCTQCDSGVALCYNNLCDTCSLEEDGCECAANCYNCGTFTENCTCECQDGWYGTDCSTVCEDTHQNCWQNPGWYGPEVCDLHASIPKGCPYMCGVCNLADPNFVCGGTNATTSSSTVTIETDTTMRQTSITTTEQTSLGHESGSTTEQGITSTSAEVPTSQSSVVVASDASSSSSTDSSTPLPISASTSTSLKPTQTSSSTVPSETTTMSQSTSTGVTTRVTTAVTGSECDDACLNGGTLDTSTCACTCADEYQGSVCQNVKSQVQYGVEIQLIADINAWSSFVNTLLRIVAEIVTSWCNVNFATCCPNQGSKTSNETLAYANESDVVVADGYPAEDTTGTANPASFWVMLLVSPPLSTELCQSGSTARRRRRWAPGGEATIRQNSLSDLHRWRRSTDDTSYLDQEALLSAITDNIAAIEDALNVTIGTVTRGEVETTDSTTSLSLGVIIGSSLAAVAVAVTLLIVGVFLVSSHKKKSTKVACISSHKGLGT